MYALLVVLFCCPVLSGICCSGHCSDVQLAWSQTSFPPLLSSGRIPMNQEFTTLEAVCAHLKRQDPQILSALARQLNSILDPDSLFNPENIRFAGDDPLNPQNPISYAQLSHYLELASGERVPALFEICDVVVPSDRILINRSWLQRQLQAARGSFGVMRLLQSEAANTRIGVSVAANAVPTNLIQQPRPMTSDQLSNLHLLLAHQNDQRKASEAASREAIARKEAELRADSAETLLGVTTAENQYLKNRVAELEKELAESKRESAIANGRLEEFEPLVEFLNPENPLSPPEGRNLFQCWAYITKNGTYDYASTAKGLSYHLQLWSKEYLGTVMAKTKMKSYRLLLTPSSRKKGGVIAIGGKKR